MATRPESVFTTCSSHSSISSEKKHTNPNTLFNFLTSYSEKPQFLIYISKNLGSFKKSAPDEPSFYQIDLPLEKQTANTEENAFIRQQSQHIRFYTIAPNTPVLEKQDHYTAVYVTHEKTEYKLQVYFDIHDTTKLIYRSILSIKDDEGQFHPIPSIKGLESLKNSSTLTVVKTVTLLRKELAHNVRALQKQYFTIEDELSSDETLDIEDATYLKKLDSITSTLDNLLAQSNYPYQSLHAFIQFMIKQFQLRDLKPDSLLSPIDAEIDNLLSHFKSLTDDIPTCIDKICPLLEKIHAVFISLKDETVTASLLSLKKLLKLHIDLYDKSERMLLKSIEKHRFEFARKLTPFYCFLSMDHMVFALKKCDATLLKFILNNGNAYIPGPLVINNIHYPSAAHFCLDHDSEQTPMAACFSVLMQHENSAMVTNAEGLPLAYIILSSTNHPLSHAFFADESTLQNTVGSVKFYQDLIEALDHLPHHTIRTMNTNEKSMVRVEIAFYNKQIERIKIALAMPAAPPPYTVLDFNKEHDTFLKEHLQKDIHIVKLQKSLVQLTAEHQFNAINRHLTSKAYFEHLTLPSTTYVLMRSAVKTCLLDLKLLVKKKIELDEIRKAVNKPFLKSESHIKQSLFPARSCYTEICELAKKNGIPDEDIHLDLIPPSVPKRLLQLSSIFYAPRTTGSFFDLNAFINGSSPNARCVPGEDDEQEDNPLSVSIT